MQEMTLKVQDPDGTIRHVLSIASDWDDVGNQIAEGHLQEADRYRVLYEHTKRRLALVSRRMAKMDAAIRNCDGSLQTLLSDLAKV